jgi:hypothetical protein
MAMFTDSAYADNGHITPLTAWQLEKISPAPRHYMIGCLYPTHAQTALQALHAARPDLIKRIRGLKANASPLPPKQLDKLNQLAASDVQTWVRDEIACAREFGLKFLAVVAERTNVTSKL